MFRQAYMTPAGRALTLKDVLSFPCLKLRISRITDVSSSDREDHSSPGVMTSSPMSLSRTWASAGAPWLI